MAVGDRTISHLTHQAADVTARYGADSAGRTTAADHDIVQRPRQAADGAAIGVDRDVGGAAIGDFSTTQLAHQTTRIGIIVTWKICRDGAIDDMAIYNLAAECASEPTIRTAHQPADVGIAGDSGMVQGDVLDRGCAPNILEQPDTVGIKVIRPVADGVPQAFELPGK